MAKENIKISVMMDEYIFRNSLQRMAEDIEVSDRDIIVKAYQDGQEFLEAKTYLTEDTHILVLNDILSKQSGLAVTQKLRQLPGSERFYIIMLTQGSSEEDTITAYRMGVDYVIARPINIRVLQAVIERVLERQVEAE